ncbi:MAG: carbohydrate kinase family protein [Armatimonadetes bacterium]|nr:carbohydrate kinase family protein [Armatimonadota bacterium]
MYDLITVGSATEDVFVFVEQARLVRLEDKDAETAYLALPHGSKIPVDHLHVMTGGGATNVAVAAATMGLKTAALCMVGKDESGRRVVAELTERGVDTALVHYSDTFRTGYSVLLSDYTGERTILVHRGATNHLALTEGDRELLAQTQWLYVGSLRGPAAHLFFELAAFVAEVGVKFAVNPGSAQLALGIDGLKPVLEQTDVLFINKTEAYELTGVEPERSRADEQRMLEMLHEAGCKTVVITAGSEGADAYDGESFYSMPAYKVKVASTVGAGDSFAAGCLAALHRGLSLPEAIQIGAANAAGVVSKIGAKEGLLTWEEAVARATSFGATSG